MWTAVLLLHGATDQRAVVENVLVLVAVAVAARQNDGARVAVLREAATSRSAVVVGDTIGVGVRVMITGSAHLEPIAVACGE